MSVAQLTPATIKPDQGVIENLEKALALAKDGKLREVLIIGSFQGGDFFHNASFKDGPLLLGYIDMCHYSIVEGMFKTTDNL